MSNGRDRLQPVGRVGDAGAPPPPSVVPIGARDRDDRWVSSAAVRQAIGAWIYSPGAAHRPSDAQVRTALGVAHAIHERALDDVWRRFADRTGAGEGTVGAQGEPFVPEDAIDLADRAGIDARDVEAALGLLVLSRAVARHHGATVPALAVSADLLVPLPAVRRLEWATARARLRAVDASIPPAVAVLREIGVRVGALPLGESPSPVRASVRDLEEATGFGRGTVGEALAALERAGLLTAEVRAGRTTRFTLRPLLYGIADGPSSASWETAGGLHAGDRASRAARPATFDGDRPGSATSPARADDTAPQPVQGRERRQSPPHTMPPPATQHDATGAIPMTFGGMAVQAPAGTPIALERDELGRWICRIGPLTLGPIDA